MRTEAYQAYNQNHTAIATPEKLIEMLYEGILKFTSLAKRAIEKNDIEKKTKYINRSIDIFVELISSLRETKEGGTIVPYLRGLYQHQITLLSQANLENSTKELDTVLHVASTLLEAWREEVYVAKTESAVA